MRAVKNKDSSVLILRRQRILLGLEQKDVANRAHINKAYYSLIESGEKIPSNDVLKSICKVLDIENWKDLIN